VGSGERSGCGGSDLQFERVGDVHGWGWRDGVSARLELQLSGILGQIEAKPLIGETWADAKAAWFAIIGHKLYEIAAKEGREFWPDVPRDAVERYHRSAARTRIVTAPARSGKSFMVAMDHVPFCMPTEPLLDARIMLVGIKYDNIKEFDYLYELFVEQRSRIGMPYEIERAIRSPGAGSLEIRFVKGRDKKGHLRRTIIKGFSSENERSLQGEQWTRATLSEAAEHQEHILSKYISTRASWIDLPTTPKPHAAWLRDLSERGAANPGMNVETHPITPHANPLYDWKSFASEKVAAEMRARDLMGPAATAEDDPMFAEQFLGRWVVYSGRVLPFMRSRHVVPVGRIDLSRCTFAASVDYGYSDPCSVGIWAIHPTGILVRTDEIYQRGLSTPEVVTATENLCRRRGIELSFVTGDPARPDLARLFQDAGLQVYARYKRSQKDRAAGHQRLVDLLTAGPLEGYPGLYVEERCVNTIREWERLHYNPNVRDEHGKAAILGRDDTYDDTRYFLMARPQPEAEDAMEKRRDWLSEALWQHSPAAQRHYWPEELSL
jgi:hypothetical protein